MKRVYLPFLILFVLLVLMNNSIEALFVSPEMVVKKIRVFPPFKVATIANDTLNNAYFKNKKTIVILAHLGCAPAMVLLRDIQKRSDLFDYQHLIVLENTKKQIEEFNADSASIWNETRLHYGLLPIQENVVAECPKETVKFVNGVAMIGSQCRKMSKDLRTKSSPTIYIVNEMGMIERKVEGYPIDNTLEVRVKSLLKN